MESRLAGQHSADRRRRRLSSELHDEELFQEFFPDTVRASVAESVSPPLQGSETELVRRVISPTLWKHMVVLTGGALMIAVVLWQECRIGSGVPEFGQHLSLGITGLLLLLSGQLALVTGWLRTDSEIDFQGRYRWWKWLAGGFFAAALIVATHSQSQVSSLVAGMLEPLTGSIRAAKSTIVLVPGITFCIIVLGRILPDMSRSRLSQSLLVIAVLMMTVRLALQHNAANVTTATFDAMMLVSAYFTFASMLLHCRYVAFICNDPPVQNVVSAATEMETIPLPAEEPVVEIEKPATKSKPRKTTKKRTRKAA